MGSLSSTPLGRTRPKTSGAYLAASAAYKAGFRGWPLVIMTAIAGQQSGWNPTSLNNNPSTGDYSIGLWQINYYGNLAPSRTSQFGQPASLLSNPQDQANAAYQLAGGNELVGLQNWALTPSPQTGQTPTPETGGASIAQFIPSAIGAASEVGEFGPASASQIAQASTWPGSSPLGTALTSGGNTNPNPFTSASNASGTTGQVSGCGTKSGSNLGAPHNVFTIPHTSSGLTFCQAKAILGGLSVAAGGVVFIIGLASLLYATVGGKSAGAKAIAPVVLVAGNAGRGVRAVRTRRSSRRVNLNDGASSDVGEGAAA